jgi:outer membrane cobalamin receptor
MIRSIAFVLSASAAGDPIQALHDQVVPVEPATVDDTTSWPPRDAPFRSWVYTSDDLERFGARSLGDVMRLTPGVVVHPGGGIYVHGTPLGDGSIIIDGVRVLGAPRAHP